MFWGRSLNPWRLSRMLSRTVKQCILQMPQRGASGNLSFLADIYQASGGSRSPLLHLATNMHNAHSNSFLIRAARTDDASAIASLARHLLIYEKSLNETMGEMTAWAASADEVRKQM